MSTALVLVIGLTLLIAAAIAFALSGLLQYRIAGLLSADVRLITLLAIIGIGALLSVALTTRSLNESLPGVGDVVLYDDYASGFASSRWMSLFLLGAALIEIVRGWLRARPAPRSDPAWPLLAAMLLFYVGVLVVQGLFSEHVGFSHKELYLPIILLAAYHQPVRNLPLVLGGAKIVVLALMLGSLLGIAIRPDFVMHRPEPGVIPGIDWRLFGLTSHANTLGPVALLGLLLELHSPSRRRWLRWLHLAAAGAVFVLAQSRTAWVAAVLIGVVVWVPLSIAPRGGAGADPHGFSRATWTLVGCAFVLIVAACGMVAFGGTEYLQRKTDLGTLNGRFQIWDITLQAWRDNILFGYGPEIWGEARRLRFNMFHVGQAHNQFVQTLGEAGVAGLALLLVYLLTFLYAAWHRFAASRGLILALLLVLLARCVTEAPMRSEGLLSWASFLHVLLVVVACHHLRQPRAAWSPLAPVLGRRGHAPAGARVPARMPRAAT
jgi:exopolysaccharide production protein ExoQ